MLWFYMSYYAIHVSEQTGTGKHAFQSGCFASVVHKRISEKNPDCRGGSSKFSENERTA